MLQLRLSSCVLPFIRLALRQIHCDMVIGRRSIPTQGAEGVALVVVQGAIVAKPSPRRVRIGIDLEVEVA
jgi:hypothetical protein